jgi:predicted SprT family Zn-dependent metalloprotease
MVRRMPCSDDEFPELSEISGVAKIDSRLRRSPRKKATEPLQAAGTRGNESRTKHADSTQKHLQGVAPVGLMSAIPRKKLSPRSEIVEATALKSEATSRQSSASYNNSSSSKTRTMPVQTVQLSSLGLSLPPLLEPCSKGRKPTITTRVGEKKSKISGVGTASKFVLSEPRCNDDDLSDEDDKDEEDTDLSGFIVDDDADLSHHEWSDSDRPHKVTAKARRKLFRGSPHRKSKPGRGDSEVSLDEDSLIAELDNLKVSGRRHSNVTIIDLTESPSPPEISAEISEAEGHSPKMNLMQRFNDALRLSPPVRDNLSTAPRKTTVKTSSLAEPSSDPVSDRFQTPPTTPPQSPSKLKSPSKLLSPSKKEHIPRSPHRQSTDAFWDLHTTNSWNDQHSPKKGPVASPRKQRVAQFQIWSDDAPDDDQTPSSSTSSLPSPCASPTKNRSPLKSPEKAEKQLLLKKKREAKARKAAFNAAKESMACELLAALDKGVTKNKIATLSATTGGVKVVWSNTLRSTAGRANWRRTVTKLSGSPIKGNILPEGPGIEVQHFAHIELASKVIDSEDRLVNTLAHEFCHLANFMISNVRDQPHGASFKQWAAKVSSHLKHSDNDVWRKVEVTTKHDYKIDHKYLWVCIGREQSKAAAYLNIEEDDEGCGAEYGRHSKSIDTRTQRCGRCKGRLLQVRPTPRQPSPVKKVLAKANAVDLAKAIEVLELSD